MKRKILIGILSITVMMLSSDTEETEIPEDNAPTGDYRDIYTWMVEKEAGDSLSFSLIYLDEDDIPELAVSAGFEFGGIYILTFHEGFLDKWRSDRCNVTYIEKGNLICNSDGKMGCYIEIHIWDGEDENAGYWDGEEISEEEYNARLNSVYPTEQAVKPEKYYSMKDICSILRTGEVW